ncbi:MAG: 3'-5' exonuclease [Hyphomonadaceae bacterium]|nr:3'-5' exonuclease [Hyphomonadaceae bacterium]
MDLEDAARLIEASRDYRLLRRLPAPSAWTLSAPGANLRRAVFVDTETTGLDPDTGEVIELAMVPFDYDRDSGAIAAVHVDAALSSLRQPSKPITPESTAIHGIRNEDVAGTCIDAAQVSTLLDQAQLVIAHNAAFDRPMVEKLWPAFETKHWACSLADVDWKAEGLGSAKLDYLLMRQGWFFDDHRALADALAALFLLTLPLPKSGRPALAAMLESARRPLRAVRAEATAFEQRAALKSRGYKWDEGAANRPKAWWKLTDDPQAEIDWLHAEIYGDDRDVRVINMPATRRYSSRLWPD